VWNRIAAAGIRILQCYNLGCPAGTGSRAT